MRKILLFLAVLSFQSQTVFAGNRYVLSPDSVSKRIIGKQLEVKSKLPVIPLNPERYRKAEGEVKPSKKVRYFASNPVRPLKDTAPKFSLFLPQKNRAMCYDVLEGKWESADENVLKGSYLAGKIGNTAVFQKGSLYCYVEVKQ